MKKSYIFILIAVILLGGLAWQFTNQVDTEGRVHTELYEGAKGVQEMNLTVSGFRTQDIDGEEIGSSSYLHIEWEAPAKEYNHFLLTITEPVSGWTETQSGEHERFSLDVGDLEAATEYTIALQACLQPRCDDWYIINEEVVATTPHRYWQLDGEVPTDHVYELQDFAYVPTESDLVSEELLSEQDIVLRPEDTSIDELAHVVNGRQLTWIEASLLIDEATLYLIDGKSYEQKALIPITGGPGTTTGYVSATLLNP